MYLPSTCGAKVDYLLPHLLALAFPLKVAGVTFYLSMARLRMLRRVKSLNLVLK